MDNRDRQINIASNVSPTEKLLFKASIYGLSKHSVCVRQILNRHLAQEAEGDLIRGIILMNFKKLYFISLYQDGFDSYWQWINTLRCTLLYMLVN